MPDFVTVFQLLQGTPVPTFLVAAGIFFVFLAIIGRFAWGAILTLLQRVVIGTLGTIFMLSGIALFVVPTLPPPLTPTPTFTPTNTPTTGPTDIPTPTNTPIPGCDAVIAATSTVLSIQPTQTSGYSHILYRNDCVELLAITEDSEWVKATKYYGDVPSTGWLRISSLRLNISLDDLPVE